MLGENGIFNTVIKSLNGEPILFLMKPAYFRSIIVFANAWKETGWGTIIYLAAISNIDQNLYEAAIIDGANRLQRAYYITLSSIKSTIATLIILRLGSLMNNNFEAVFMLYNAVNLRVADVFELYTYRMGLQMGRYGYSTAVGLFQSVVGFLLILIGNTAIKKMGERGVW